MAFGVKVKISPQINAKNLRSEIQVAIENATQGKPVKIRHLEVELGRQEAARVSKQLESAIASQNITLKIAKIDASKPVANLRKQLTTMLSGLSITGLKEFLGADGAEDSYNRAANAANKLADAQENARQKTASTNASLRILTDLQKQLSTISQSVMSVQDPYAIEQYIAKYQELTGAVQNAKTLEGTAQTEATTKILSSVVALKQKVAAQLESEKAAKRAAASEVSEEEAAARAARESETSAKKEATFSRQVIQLRQRINALIKDSPIAYRANRVEIDAMLVSLQDEGKLSEAELAKIRTQFERIRASAKESGIAGKSFFTTIKGLWAKLGDLSIITSGAMTFTNFARSMVVSIKEIDAAMTELKKVTDLTSQAYANFIKQAATISKNVGATLSDTINATADFSRLGYGINDASALAEAALVYKNVGDGITDISIATESLISTMKAFDYEANASMSIVDKFNEVGNNFAISSSGIGEALQRSASAMASAGNTLEESIGLITAMNNVVQNPETVGTTLKTVSMYLRAAKTEAESAGESTEGMASSVSKLRQELLDLTGQKVDIMIDKNTFKSTYEIMKDLSRVWGELTDASRANILERIGGKRNANAVSALLTNFKDAEEAMKVAMKAMGSATAENEKFLDSINGKMATLKARFEELSALTIGGNLIKRLVDLANGVLSLATSLQKVHTLLPAVTAISTAIKGIMNGLRGGEAVSSIMSAVGNGMEDSSLLASVAAATGKLTNAQKKFVAAQIEARIGTNGLTKELAAQIINATGLSTALGVASSAGKSFSDAVKGIGASFKSWNGVLIAIELIYTAVSFAIDSYNQKIQESIDKANEIVSSYSDAQSTYQSNKKTLKGLKGEFDKLSAGVDSNGRNVKLTADQYEQYLSIIDQIVSISPRVVTGYDTEGRAIMNYSSALEDAIAKQEEYITNERAMYLASGKDLFSGKANEYEEYLRELGQAGKEIKWPIYGGNIWSGYDTNKLSAVKDIFEEMGINIKTIDHWWQNYDDLMSLYERSSELITRLQNTGLYKPNEIDEIRNSIYGLSGAYTQIKAIEQEEVSFLATWAQDKAWFMNTPMEATDALVDGLSSVVDATKSYNENIKLAEAYGNEFSEVIQSEVVTNLRDMANGLSDGLNDGEEELEAYNDALADFAKGFDNPSAAIVAVIAYLNGLSNAYRTASDDTQNASYQTKGLAAAIDSLTKGYNVLKKAEEDMASKGRLSTDTISAMLALMEEGEQITDYLIYENGVLTLNRKAWEDRSRASGLGDVEAMKKRLEYLKEIKAAQETVDKYSSSRPITDEQTVEFEEARAALRGYEGDLTAVGAEIDTITESIELYNNVDKDVFDPLNLTALISNLNNISSEAKSLLSVLDELKDGSVLTSNELANLALQYPSLFKNKDLFDTKTLEGQIALIEDAIRLYEEEYDAAIQAQIAVLETARTEAETSGLPIGPIESLIQTLTQLKSMTLKDIFGTSNTDKAAKSYANLSDAIGDLASSSSMLEDMMSGKDYMSTAQKLFDFIGENERFTIDDFFNQDGSIKSVDDALITKVFDSWLEMVKELDGYTPEFGEKLREQFKLSVEGADESAEGLEKFSKSMNSLSEGADLLAEMKSGENYIAQLQEIADFINDHNGEFTLLDFINDDGSIKEVNTELIDNLYDKLSKQFSQMTGYTDSMGAMLRKAFDDIVAGEEDVISSSEKVSNALSSIENTGDFFQKISSKDSTVIEQINSAIDLADSLKDADGNIPDWTSWIKSVSDGGAEIEWTDDAIRALSDAQVDNAFATTGLAEKYPELIQQIKSYNHENILAAAAAERMADSHEKVSSALSAQKDYSGYTQITLDAYQELIDADQRYAAAIEYQNGVYVLNGQKHTQVTQTILAETKALAEAEKQAILTSDEYQKLTKALELGQLDKNGMQRLLDLNVQIQGYDTLANEIDNASSAYARWVNRRGDDGMDRYSQAMEAFELLNATLNEQESEYYGRIGREEFTQAVDFVIGENIKVNTPEFERAMALAQRYLIEGAEGATNFYDDMVSSGLLDETTGAMDTTIAEISTKLGLTEEMVRTMIDRVNEYQDESAKIKVKEPEVSEASEAESQIAQLIKTLEDAQTYATTLSETPIDIQITDGENKKELLSSMSTALDTIKSCIQSIIASPLSFNMDDLSLAVETVKGYITKIQEALRDTDDLSIDVNTNDSEDKLSALQGNAQLVKEAFDGIVATLQAVMSGVNTVNSNELEIKPGRTPQLLGEVSSQLSGIITKLQQIAKNSKITIRINEVTTSSKGSGGSAISKLGSWLGSVFGRANAGGTMKSPGGKTLVGELGMETVVDPHTNQWYTVGERGAEFVTLPKDAIVFNHKQTEELFGTGRIDSRGDAMASGNAAASLLGGLVSSAKNFVSKALGKTTAAIQQAAGVAASTAAGTAVSALAKPLSDSVASLGTHMSGGTSKNQSSTGNGGGSGGNSSAEEEESILEKLKKKYEELDEAIQHLIRHQEFLYFQAEKGLNYTGMEDSLTEQARLYREIMANASEAVKEMIANGASDTDKELQEMEEKYWQAYETLYGILDQINTMYVDALNDKIDKIQGAYDNLSKAAEEFNESGGITVDSFQTLIANGVQYLSFLDNVNGQYVINEEAIQKMIAAEKEQLAIEQALSYIKQLQQALTDGDINLVAHLVDLNNQLSDSTWSVVYAQAAMLKAAGLSDEQYEQVLANINALQALSNQVTTQNIEKIDETADKEDNLNQDRLDALDKILDLTEDLIKQETEDQVDAINDQIDAYKKLIDLKKESLQKSKEENEYAKSVADKTKNIADLQAKISQLSLDDSREAQAQRAALMEELAEAQSDLADAQSDHSYDLQSDALDKMADEYEQSRQQEIEALENSISSTEKLYQLAIARISTRWDTLYDDLIAWNYESGSTLQSEVVAAWEQAQEAVLKYGSYVQAVAKLKAELEDDNPDDDETPDEIPSHPTVVATGTPSTPTPTPTNPSKPPANPVLPAAPSTNALQAEVVEQPVQAVEVSNGRWHVRADASAKSASLGVVGNGTKLEYTGQEAGEWYSVIYNGQQAWINKGCGGLKKYHTGGIVGGKEESSDKEVMALLEKGEAVLDKPKKEALYEIVDFQDVLMEKLGSFIGNIQKPFLQFSPRNATPALAGVSQGNAGVVFNPNINVNISHNGAMSDRDANQYGKQIAKTALDTMYDSFVRRGISNISSRKLKQ